ncbi:MAG: DUF2339 domain-containing protein [Gemmatimonadaceae bacterium]
MDSDDAGGAGSLEVRIASLEASVRALSTELEQMRGQPRADLPPSASAPAFADPTPLPRSRLDLESLVGRYGTLVLATIMALAAVGTFLGWAVSHGWLGPSQRIALGLIAAVALAAAGFRLRRRERSFGASLLGLALAIALVCAWGAGPSLQLVPPVAAFLFAAATSIALTVFAHAEADEPLWSVGFTGAAIAPFVTASGKSDLVLLAGYGVVVLSAAGYAMGRRPWIVAGRLFLLAASAYTVALALGPERDAGPLLATGFPLIVGIVGVLPWISGWPRRERLRALGALAALVALRSGIATGLPTEPRTTAALLAVAALVWLVLVDRTHAVGGDTAQPSSRRLYEGDWLDAGALPLAFVLGTMMALDAGVRTSGFAMVIAATVLLVSVARLSRGSLRDAAVFATVLCALIAALLLLRARPLEFTAAIAGISAACFLANLVWRSAAWATLGLIGFVWAFIAMLVHLTARTAYEYTPFLTRESLGAAVLLAGIAIGWRTTADDARLGRLMLAGVWVWAFAWVHQELSFAVSPTVSTLLRVTYYAVTSVLAVAVGRARRIALARHAGLALAILAAGTALTGARHLDAIAARIVADLVAAVFLLAIAYWYRRPGGLKTER